jgi:hypothetical protein
MYFEMIHLFIYLLFKSDSGGLILILFHSFLSCLCHMMQGFS